MLESRTIWFYLLFLNTYLSKAHIISHRSTCRWIFSFHRLASPGCIEVSNSQIKIRTVINFLDVCFIVVAYVNSLWIEKMYLLKVVIELLNPLYQKHFIKVGFYLQSCLDKYMEEWWLHKSCDKKYLCFLLSLYKKKHLHWYRLIVINVKCQQKVLKLNHQFRKVLYKQQFDVWIYNKYIRTQVITKALVLRTSDFTLVIMWKKNPLYPIRATTFVSIVLYLIYNPGNL